MSAARKVLAAALCALPVLARAGASTDPLCETDGMDETCAASRGQSALQRTTAVRAHSLDVKEAGAAMDVGTEKLTLTEVFAVSPPACYDAFWKYVWVGGGGLGPAPRILEQGDPTTGVGSIRQVPGFIKEEVLEASKGKYLEYHVKSGPFPVSYHRGRVEFSAKQDSGLSNAAAASAVGETQVTWTVSYTPLPLMGYFIGFVIRTSLGMMLRNLARKLRQSGQEGGSSGGWWLWIAGSFGVATAGFFLAALLGSGKGADATGGGGDAGFDVCTRTSP
eukprot:CAMPEP_0175563596 /NCGR_PEP_ID=MMETSP0096-20121207/38503_1 /TAXON_ID=311494 /ORGANISM="Alexandrium monilatum, Strain CCMP3105" /LENGTH=277 /DNA_ID=CAMNT_0016866843 /DNA_START=9 /DNA_END=840 /DNA_ORIENTATION=+